MTTGGHAVIIRALRRERANIRVRLRQGYAMSADRRQTLEYEAAILDHVIAGLEDGKAPGRPGARLTTKKDATSR